MTHLTHKFVRLASVIFRIKFDWEYTRRIQHQVPWKRLKTRWTKVDSSHLVLPSRYACARLHHPGSGSYGQLLGLIGILYPYSSLCISVTCLLDVAVLVTLMTNLTNNGKPNDVSCFDSQVFQGNMDNTNIQSLSLSTPFIGRFVKINVKTYHSWPSLRVELYGCTKGFWNFIPSQFSCTKILI